MKQNNATSFWDKQMWFSNIDFAIIGSGIVGLNCALKLRQEFPKAKILVLERGVWPQGASTKNAGFACFGSVSELLSDLKTHSEEDVFQLVKKRISGLKLLRETLGDTAIDFQQHGGYEVFLEDNKSSYENCFDNIKPLNKLLKPLFKVPFFQEKPNVFEFKKVFSKLIFNPFEGQIDTGKMMLALLKKAHQKNILILNGCFVKSYSEDSNSIKIESSLGEFSTKKLLVATNGFAEQFGIPKVTPARAQVLVTKPIKSLKIKGTFHIDEGYYYFRNINNRILLGGGRNLDVKGETTSKFGETAPIQRTLENYLKDIILPQNKFEIDQRWSGIMGVGYQKKPIIKAVGNNVFCGVRLGGMGIAIGTQVGYDLAKIAAP